LLEIYTDLGLLDSGSPEEKVIAEDKAAWAQLEAESNLP
jgi:hypothetical protein